MPAASEDALEAGELRSVDRPDFSVIIPAFNAEHTIETTVRSVLGQTHCSFEVIVVDDGSTDGTAAVLEALVAEDQRVRVVSKPNGGCASARNAGCEAARANLVALLDADDAYLPNYLEAMHDLAGRYPGRDIYSCNGIRRKGRSEEHVFRGTRFSRERPFTLEEMIEADLVFVIAVFRRSIHERVGGFREGLPYGEDYDFWLRCFAEGAQHMYTPQVLAVHVRSVSSKSANLAAHAAGIKRILTDLGEQRALGAAERDALARSLHAIEMRIERVALESRLKSGDFHGARSSYMKTRPAYISPLKFLAGLAVISISPRLYAVLLARR